MFVPFSGQSRCCYPVEPPVQEELPVIPEPVETETVEDFMSTFCDAEYSTSRVKVRLASKKKRKELSKYTFFHHWSLLPAEMKMKIMKEMDFVSRRNMLTQSRSEYSLARSFKDDFCIVQLEEMTITGGDVSSFLFHGARQERVGARGQERRFKVHLNYYLPHAKYDKIKSLDPRKRQDFTLVMREIGENLTEVQRIYRTNGIARTSKGMFKENCETMACRIFADFYNRGTATCVKICMKRYPFERFPLKASETAQMAEVRIDDEASTLEMLSKLPKKMQYVHLSYCRINERRSSAVLQTPQILTAERLNIWVNCEMTTAELLALQAVKIYVCVDKLEQNSIKPFIKEWLDGKRPKFESLFVWERELENVQEILSGFTHVSLNRHQSTNFEGEAMKFIETLDRVRTRIFETSDIWLVSGEGGKIGAIAKDLKIAFIATTNLLDPPHISILMP
ncbi:unnamed protein product [Caenorhabditis auriculariae]|uniref:F-box domain-containing protein n=1 Tax=Caenorhabditis auriculariae TaxID=2777116 RepID=A0A8S1HBU5_9PELO|nr:unnamed protein product [Caenorhabditis auriculariae]